MNELKQNSSASWTRWSEWIGAAIVTLVAVGFVFDFLFAHWKLSAEQPTFFSCFKNVFGVYQIFGHVVSGWLVVGATVVSTACLVTLAGACQSSRDNPSALWMRWLLGALLLAGFVVGAVMLWSEPWAPVLYWAVGWLAYCAVIGHLIMRCWEAWYPGWARLCVAFVIGLSTTGVMVELMTMAHLFRRGPILLAAALLLLVVTAVYWTRDRNWSDYRRRDRQASERDEFDASILRPRGVAEQVIWHAAMWLTVVITGLTFYHGVCFPEVYWDSLILYLGYARMTFLEGAFPFKAVAQVGIGLGANYPHLYPTLVATGPMLAGEWHTIGGQFAAPLAGLVSCVLTYHIALRLTRQATLAALVTLLFRAVPLGVFYFIFASDYALGMLFAIAFVYVAMLHMEAAERGYLVALTLITVGAAHINYLMLALWGLWGLVIVLAHAGRRLTDEEMADVSRERALAGKRFDPPPQPGLTGLLRLNWFWGLLVAGLLLSSTWYVRNTVLTGNPVYSFFPELFGGVRINPAVLESCHYEWMSNGAGIARVGDRYGIPYDELTAFDKLKGSWWFFHGWRGQSWRWQPFFFAWVIPGVLVWLVAMLPRAFRGGRRFALRFNDVDRAGLLAAALLGGFLFYHIAVADFYLYQILPALGAWPVFLAASLEAARGRLWRQIMAGAVIVAAVAPGLAFALMGAKIADPQLRVLRSPGLSQMEMVARRFGADAEMVEAVNERCVGGPLLTHENRHVLFDPSITLVHLDDWETQQLWEASDERLIAGLKALGISYYLRVPNEVKHGVNARLGLQRLIDNGQLNLVGQWGENALYVLD